MTNAQAALTAAPAAVLVDLWALGLGHSLVIGHWSLVISSKGSSLVLNSTAVHPGPLPRGSSLPISFPLDTMGIKVAIVAVQRSVRTQPTGLSEAMPSVRSARGPVDALHG